MLLTENKLAQWVESKNGLVITRSVINIYNFDFLNVNSSIIACITGYPRVIEYFFNDVINKLYNGVILIIIESDVVPISKEHLNHINLIHCFTWNKPFFHKKLSPLPIGLNFNRQYNSLQNWLNQHEGESVGPRKLLCFNGSLHTDHSRKELVIKAQTQWKSFCTILDQVPFLDKYYIPSHIEGKILISVTNPKCYDQWSGYKFVLSPKGAGIDCHRTWEALSMGCIPIVISSTIDELYKDLPVLILKSWDEIDEKLLHDFYCEYKNKICNNEYNLQKLQLEYWIKKIEEKTIINRREKIHFITYGNEKFKNAKTRILNEAKHFNEFSSIYAYGPENLPEEFQNKYKDILNRPRGGGYWIWRPIIIKQALDKMNENEFLVYLDAGCVLNAKGKKRFYEYIQLLDKSDYGVLSFQMSGNKGPGTLEIEKKWTIKEIFDLLNINMDSNFANSGQYLGGVLILQKNKHLMEYMEEYTNIVLKHSDLCTDDYNHQQTFSGFVENRHEQSITSLLRKKMGSVVIDGDESWMPPFGKGESIKYPFWATRNKN